MAEITYAFELVAQQKLEVAASVFKVLDADGNLVDCGTFVRGVEYTTTDYRTISRLLEEPGLISWKQVEAPVATEAPKLPVDPSKVNESKDTASTVKDDK